MNIYIPVVFILLLLIPCCAKQGKTISVGMDFTTAVNDVRNMGYRDMTPRAMMKGSDPEKPIPFTRFVFRDNRAIDIARGENGKVKYIYVCSEYSENKKNKWKRIRSIEVETKRLLGLF